MLDILIAVIGGIAGAYAFFALRVTREFNVTINLLIGAVAGAFFAAATPYMPMISTLSFTTWLSASMGAGAALAFIAGLLAGQR